MKKLFALLLVLAMVLSMAACGNSNNEETQQPEGTTAPVAEVVTPTGPVYEYTFHTSMTALVTTGTPTLGKCPTRTP